MKNKCKDDCPKGGMCPREVKGTTEGKLYVVNHFECKWIQQFILKYANWKPSSGHVTKPDR